MLSSSSSRGQPGFRALQGSPLPWVPRDAVSAVACGRVRRPGQRGGCPTHCALGHPVWPTVKGDVLLPLPFQSVLCVPSLGVLQLESGGQALLDCWGCLPPLSSLLPGYFPSWPLRRERSEGPVSRDLPMALMSVTQTSSRPLAGWVLTSGGLQPPALPVQWG